ncbi:hypothetical protein [Haloquadratum walsbyi]|uniref:hypothetical protein n=1 Tax=Haloquadratum walsbyi TaxID=293091 RepID=UPI00064EDED7|nr:hypothetical protein [Haloquadratum walsbyi]
MSVDDRDFDTANRVSLTIQLRATDLISPRSYTVEITISSIEIESDSQDVQREDNADVYFLLDNSISARNDLNAIRDGINVFFDAVEKTSNPDRINLAASVSEFGGKKVRL